jgi:hypothetical protein
VCDRQSYDGARVWFSATIGQDRMWKLGKQRAQAMLRCYSVLLREARRTHGSNGQPAYRHSHLPVY